MAWANPDVPDPTIRGEFYVYGIFDPFGVPRYIGKGKGNRCHRHAKRSNNRHLSNLYKKYGDGMRVIKLYTGISEDWAFHTEKCLIEWLGRSDRFAEGTLVNFTDGGEGPSGYKPSEEARRKNGIAHKGMKRSEETKARISASLKGKPKNPESIEKSRLSRIGVPSPQKGRKRSEEAKQRMREAALRRAPISEETRLRLSESMKGRAFSEETRRKISEAKKGKPSPWTAERNRASAGKKRGDEK